jgi:hypothetical protein
MPSTILSNNSGSHSLQKLSVLLIYSLLFFQNPLHAEMEGTKMCVETQVMDMTIHKPTVTMNIKNDVKGRLQAVFKMLSRASIT